MDERLPLIDRVLYLTRNRSSGTINSRESDSRHKHRSPMQTALSESDVMVSDKIKAPRTGGVQRQMNNFAQLVLSDLLHKVPSESRSRVRQTGQWLANQVVSRNYDHLGVVETLVRRGCSGEMVVGYCIPMAARILGDEWASDLRSFAEVTLGSARLGEILKEMSDVGQSCRNEDEDALLVIACRGEQHILGAQVLADQLCRAKQPVKLIIDATWEDVTKLYQTGDFSALLFSCAGIHALPELNKCVNKVRQTFGAGVPIVVGGQMVQIDPSKLSNLSVDLVSNDIDIVLSMLELLKNTTKDNLQTES